MPLGVVALPFARRMVPQVRAADRVRLDWPGFLLCAGGIAALVVAMERIGVGAVAWRPVLLGLAGSGLLLGWSVRHLLRARVPLLNLRICRLPTFRVMAVGGSVSRLVVSAVPFLVTLTSQVGFGWSPLRSGLLVISLLVSTLGVILSLLLCALIRPVTTTAVIVGLLVVHGAVRSISFAAYNSIAYAEVSPGRLNDANTLVTALQQLAAGLGVAITALVLRAAGGLLTALGRPFHRALGGGTAGYSVAFLLLAGLLLACLVEALRLPRSAGHQITQRVGESA